MNLLPVGQPFRLRPAFQAGQIRLISLRLLLVRARQIVPENAIESFVPDLY
jgi:hypothetical protein